MYLGVESEPEFDDEAEEEEYFHHLVIDESREVHGEPDNDGINIQNIQQHRHQQQDNDKGKKNIFLMKTSTN